MIVIDLICRNGHRFEGWFKSSSDFTKQKENKQLCCPICNNLEIKRQVSAPKINKIKRSGEFNTKKTQDRLESFKKEVMDYILKNTEDVGNDFCSEARKIFYNEIPEKSIRGKATKQEIEELNEEGIDVVSIPLNTTSKNMH